MERLIQDLRFAVRMLLRNRGFTAIAILTLTLGIAANTAIFSVVNTLLFRPLPFRNSDRLVWIANISPDGGLSGVTSRVANFQEWKRLNHSFEDMGAYFAFFDYLSYTMTGRGESERLVGVGISQNFLDLLGVQLALGRGFVDEECVWNGRKAVLLTDGFWRRRFGADPGIVGQSISLNNDSTLVVGVLPASFDFASTFSPGSRVDMLTPFPLTQETDRWGNTLSAIGRLKPGVSLPEAQAEFNLIIKQMQSAFPERGQGYGAVMSKLQEQVSGNFRRPFLVLFGAVACVMLIACANLSNLLLARAASRRKEIAVRVALGAQRSHLIRQMLTECVLLSFVGAALGIPLASAATRLLSATHIFNIPLLATVTVDRAALLFTAAAALGAGVLFGIVPAFQLSRSELHEDLKDSSRGSSEGRGRSWVRDTLVVSEIALACTLLVGTGLLLRSFVRLLEVDLGFHPEQALAFRVETTRRFNSLDQATSFYKDMVQRIEAIPGVESAGLTDTLPLGRNRSWDVRAKGQIYPENQTPTAFPRIVDAGYIKTMKIPVHAGRDFSTHDTSESEKVMVINETLARRLWPGKDAVGQMVLNGGSEIHVIGVVANVRHSALEEEGGPEMYFPFTQVGDFSALDLVVRTKASTAAIVPSVRAALKNLDPNMPTTQFQTLGQIVDRAVSPKRFVLMLLSGFSVFALVLASLGIYGVISYSVNQRTQEIGIRMAIGAQRSEVLRLVIVQGMKLAFMGVGFGLAASILLTSVLKKLVFGISATDPATFVGNALLLTGVALFACYIPARRAAGVDPIVALRCE